MWFTKSSKQMKFKWTTIMDQSFETLLHFWAFSNSYGPNVPSPHPTNNVGRVYPEFFFCIGWGRENCKKISKRMHCFMRDPEWQKNMNIVLLSQALLSMIVGSLCSWADKYCFLQEQNIYERIQWQMLGQLPPEPGTNAIFSLFFIIADF